MLKTVGHYDGRPPDSINSDLMSVDPTYNRVHTNMLQEQYAIGGVAWLGSLAAKGDEAASGGRTDGCRCQYRESEVLP